MHEQESTPCFAKTNQFILKVNRLTCLTQGVYFKNQPLEFENEVVGDWLMTTHTFCHPEIPQAKRLFNSEYVFRLYTRQVQQRQI